MRYSVTGSGDYNVICKVCGWKLKASQARKRWDGLQPVCPVSCWEPRHPAEFYRPRNDFHKLPYTSPDTEIAAGFFQATPHIPETLATAVIVDTNAGRRTFGNYFTSNVAGYIEAVRIYYGAEVGNEGGDEGGAYDATPADVWVALFLEGSLVWSTTVSMTQGHWTTVQVIPNLECSAAQNWTVAIGSDATRLSGGTTLTAQTRATFAGAYYSASAKTWPTTLSSATDPYLLDVKIRTTT